jgi:hypothetical protein
VRVCSQTTRLVDLDKSVPKQIVTGSMVEFRQRHGRDA